MDESMVANGIVMGLFGGLFILVIPLAVALLVGGLVLLSLGFFSHLVRRLCLDPGTSSAIGARKNFLSRLGDVQHALPPIIGQR